MKKSTAAFLARFLLTTSSLVFFYVAFVHHDALYPGSGEHLRSALVVLSAYLGFATLHRALHVQDPKDSNSPDAME